MFLVAHFLGRKIRSIHYERFVRALKTKIPRGFFYLNRKIQEWILQCLKTS